MSSEMRQHIGELDSYGQTLMRPGTSITIVGTHYITSRKDWLWEFVKAVKRNFFIAIANGSLECAVEGRRVKIDESAESDMPKDKRQKRTPAYLEAVRMYDGGSKKTISSEGLSFDIWAAASSEDDNKYENICMYVNKRGMLITREKSTRRNPFHIQRQTRGSFLVLVKSADDFTERQMRDMEPPSHAEIKVSKSPDYIDALRNIKMKIESHVRDMLFADSDPNDVAELSDLADILPIKRDAEEQTKLDVFITKPKKKHGTGKADGGTGGTQEGGKTKDTTGGGTNGGTGGGPTTEQQPQGGEGDGSGVETQLEDIRMVSGSRDSLQVYGTLSGDNGGKDRPVNVIIRRMSESKEHDEKSSRIQIKTATAAFVGEGGDEVKAEVKIHEDGRILAITTGPSVSGRRLKLDVTLNDPEPVRCAYEIGVVSTS